MNIGVFGFGDIAKEHIKAIKKLNHKLAYIITKSNKNNYCSKDRFIRFSDIKPEIFSEVDALIVAVTHKNVREVLDIVPSHIPTLYEKPLFFSIDEINHFRATNNNNKISNTYIGFNRRHYQSTIKLRQYINLSRSTFIDARFFDQYKSIQSRYCLPIEKIPFHISCHWLDLIGTLSSYQILQNINFESIHNNIFSTTNDEKFRVNLSFLPDFPGNHELNIYNEKNQRLNMLPIEELTLSTLNIQNPDPTTFTATKRYILENHPIASEPTIQIKPGYLEQMRWFLENSTANNSVNVTNERFKEYQIVLNCCQMISELIKV